MGVVLDKLPIDELKVFAEKYGLRNVVVFATGSGPMQYIVTYGAEGIDSAQAAHYGNGIRKFLGWPKNTHAESPKLEALRDAVKALVGVSTKAEADQMEVGIRITAACDADKVAALNAINALRPFLTE